MVIQWRTKLWIGCSLCFLLTALCYLIWNNSHSQIILRPNGKAILYRGGWLTREKFDLTKNGTKWLFSRSDPFEVGELILPFESPYNDIKTLRFEESGKVYILDKGKLKREELQIVNGEWSYDASDHWQSIFDMDD